MNKFNVGDRVKCVEPFGLKSELVGKTGTVVGYESNFVGVSFDNWSNGHTCVGKAKGHSGRWVNDAELVLLGKDGDPTIHFILQYELDRDPFETFATMKEVEARIKELAARADLKRESIKVYEIAKTYSVSLDTTVKMHTEELVGDERKVLAAKKRGRPFKHACDKCDFKGKSGQALGAHKRYTH